MAPRPALLLALAALLVAAMIAPRAAHARPIKGFHTGPYLLLVGGVLQEDFDRDQVTGKDVGNDFEPTFGFIFGWNIWDSFSGELQARYATNVGGGAREHIASANAYAKYTLIADALTDFPTLRILPFVKGGLATRVAALPGTPGAAHSTAARFGAGPGVGAGIAFLWKKYVYFGIDVQEDLLFFGSIDQTVGGVMREVYQGGFHPSFSGMAMVGVHY